jgi:hypothetical protein|tara:strand:- start:1353 stop:1691 length:339 start_codon:yes stop_codon:yes gene_type:complete
MATTKATSNAKPIIINPPAVPNIAVFLAQSPKTERWYFTAQSFTSLTRVDKNGDSFEYLAPKGNNDLRKLPADSIKSLILPIAWNDLDRAEVVAKVGATALMNPVTGELTLT